MCALPEYRSGMLSGRPRNVQTQQGIRLRVDLHRGRACAAPLGPLDDAAGDDDLLPDDLEVGDLCEHAQESALDPARASFRCGGNAPSFVQAVTPLRDRSSVDSQVVTRETTKGGRSEGD